MTLNPVVSTGAPRQVANPTNMVPVTFLMVDLGRDNNRVAFTVFESLQKSPYLDKEGTWVAGNTGAADEITYRFGGTLKLKYPIFR